MSDIKESAWDQIPSLNLTMDEDYSGKVKEDRRHSRSDLSALKKIIHSDVPSLPIRVASAAHGVFNGLIMDISESGCRIVIPNKLKKGELTKVRFNIEHRAVITKAIVRWTSPKNDDCIAGLEFREITHDLKKFIGTICSATLFNKGGKVTWG